MDTVAATVACCRPARLPAVPELTLSEVEMWLLTGGVALVAGFVRGFAGFGGPAILILALTQFYDPISVLTKVLVIDLAAQVRLLPTTYREINWRTAGTLTLASCLSFPLGVYLLMVADSLVIKRGIATVVACCAIVMFLGWRLRRRPNLFTLVVAGTVAGIVLGAYIAMVINVFIYAMPEAASISRANCIFWGLVTSIVLIPVFWATGDLDWDGVWRPAIVGVIYLCASWFGSSQFHLVAEDTFRRFILWLILVLSTIGIVF